MVEPAAAVGPPGPFAIFGKRRPFKEGLVREYELVGCSADFPPEALLAFEQVARSFRWAPPSGRAGTVLEPCFALWPLEGGRGVLAVRFRDDGRDDQGRPHLLRAEAVFLSGPAAADRDRLAGLLTPAGWPEGILPEPESGPAAFPVPSASDSAIREALERTAARDGRLPRMLVGRPADHRFDPSEGEVLVRVTPRDSQQPEMPATVARLRADPPASLPPLPSPAGRTLLPWALAAGGLVLAALAGWGWWNAATERGRVEDLARAAAEAEAAARRDAQAFRDEAAALRAQYEQRVTRLAADVEQRDALLKQWQERYEDAERARQLFEKELQRQGKSGDALQARVQLERSEKERLRLRAALDELNRLVNGFEKGLADWRRKNAAPAPDGRIP